VTFRHSALRTPFSDRHPQDQDADVEALPEYEEWVMKEWKQECGGRLKAGRRRWQSPGDNRGQNESNPEDQADRR
jgi:hypothetical protein